MKNVVKIGIALMILLLGIILPVTAFAASTTSVVLPKNETVNKDYFAAGQTVTLSGTVNGDAYVAGGNVIVEGVVNGDLLAAGGTVTVRGKVRDDVRVAGGQIIVSGTIGRNLTAAGGSVTVTDNAKISGSLTAGTGNLSVFAPIGKEANIGAGQVTLGNTINGDVQAGVGQLTLLPSTKILGNLTYWSDSLAQIESGASISGNTVHSIPPKHTDEQREKVAKTAAIAGVNVGFTVYSLLAALVIGLLLVSFAPVYTKNTADLLLTKPLLTLGVGFLSMVLFPFIVLLLLITVIGIPLDLMLIFGMAILIYMAKLIVGVAIGQKIVTSMDKKLSLRWTLVIGLSIYYILSIIPILGFIFWMIVGLMGIGALILQKKAVFTDFRKKNLI